MKKHFIKYLLDIVCFVSMFPAYAGVILEPDPEQTSGGSGLGNVFWWLLFIILLVIGIICYRYGQYIFGTAFVGVSIIGIILKLTGVIT